MSATQKASPEGAQQERTAEMAVTLVQQASLLTRLVFRHGEIGVSRSEASLLARLEDGPQQITALAEHEGLAQPTITRLVEHLENRGWVRRDRAPEDRRVVHASLTEEGRRAVQDFRARYRPLLLRSLEALSSEQVAALEAASEALGALVAELQREGVR
ncbi:MAG TPA: MarR family transcriptional regulator [Solirubrobacteraceae bacterium]|nr:MarR family transcriptional regulator [Solirubrobacteraceae bacterium]